MSDFVYHSYSWPLYSYIVSETAISTCSYVQILIIVLYYWMAGSSTWFFITPLLGWTYNVFWPSYHPSDLTHQGASLTANFSTHGRSHIYGLPCTSTDSLDPMDYFCTFYFAKIIPKNTCYFPYVTFKPVLMYIRGLTLKPAYIWMCAEGQTVLEFFLMWIQVTCLLAFHMP